MRSSLPCSALDAAGESQSASTPFGVAPDSAACWEVDISAAEDLIAAVADGADWPNWVGQLLHAARIVDVNARGLELVGSPVGREVMIGQPVASFCPSESWTALAELMVSVAIDRPIHAPRSKPINSFMFRNAVLTVWGAGSGRSDRLWVAVDGEIADDRSFWAVRASEQRFRRLIHHLPGALLQVDARAMGAVFYQLRSQGVSDIVAHIENGQEELVATAERLVRVTDANLGAATLFGTEIADDLIGPVAFVFAAAPDSARRVMVAHFEGRRTHAECMKVRRFDGRLIDVQLTVTYPTAPERLDVTLLSFEDVTDKLRTEEQLRKLQADYSRAARIATLGELASSIAHEVNQPLSAIAMNAETSLRWLAKDQPNIEKARELTRKISESAHRTSEIVQRVRSMAAQHDPKLAPVDLNEVAEEALLFVRHDLDSRSIQLSRVFLKGPAMVRADRVQLQQVIVNLLINALQALGPDTGGNRIEIGTAQDRSGIFSLSVRDNGAGIADAAADRIFDAFFTTKSDGMGIGLAVCQSIAASHSGTIAAANHPEGGAIFTLSLPSMKTHEEPAAVVDRGTRNDRRRSTTGA